MHEKSSARLTALICLAVIAIHAWAVYVDHHWLTRIDDDRMWFYYTGEEIGRREESAALQSAVYAVMRESGQDGDRLFRFQIRRDYNRNYIAFSGIYRAISNVVHRTGLFTSDYPTRVAMAFTIGFTASYVLVWIALLICIAASRRLDYLVALAAAITAAAGLELFMGARFQGTPHMMAGGSFAAIATHVAHFAAQFARLFVNPYPALSIFGDVPRNHFLLIVPAVFALRWAGRITASYLVLLALTFAHQSQTGMLFAYLAGADATLRPHIFRNRATAAGTVAILLLFIGRESLTTLLGVITFGAAVAILVAVATTVYFAQPILHGAWRRTEALRTHILRRGDVVADFIFIGGLWVLTAPVVYLLNHYATPEQSMYLWSQLHGRTIAVFRTTVFFGVAIWALSYLRERLGVRTAGVVMVGVLALGALPSMAVALRRTDVPTPRLVDQLRGMDTGLGVQPTAAELARADERLIYYALSRHLTEGVGVGAPGAVVVR